MDRLVFTDIPLEYLDESLDNLVLEPTIGSIPIGFHTSIDVVFRYCAQQPPSIYPVFSERVLYVIHYPRNFVKIGSSSIYNATSRVFSQAPLMGILSLAIILKRDVSFEEMESIEEDCVNYLKNVLNREYGYMDIHVNHRRKDGFNDVFKDYLKNLVTGSIETRLSIELLGEISELLAEYVMRKYENLVEPLYPPNMCLFKTSIDEEGTRILREVLYSKQHVSLGDLNTLRNTCTDRDCRGSITVLKNGLCILETRIESMEKYFVVPCDMVQYYLLIRINSRNKVKIMNIKIK